MLDKPIIGRHPSLNFILTWLERGEDWVVPPAVASEALSPLVPHMDRPPPPLSESQVRQAAGVMGAIHARYVLALLDWIDGEPETDIGALFLDNPALPDEFKRRLKHLLLVLLRGDLLPLFFSVEHRAWLAKHISLDGGAVKGGSTSS